MASAFRVGIRGAIRSGTRSSTISPRARGFSCAPKRGTDGVFRELTAARVGRTPWIEAFRKKGEQDARGEALNGEPVAPPERNLEPKRMVDSYHSVVSNCKIYNHRMGIDEMIPLLDIAISTRSMAGGYIPEFIWAHQVFITAMDYSDQLLKSVKQIGNTFHGS
jgi:hypothetical protein